MGSHTSRFELADRNSSRPQKAFSPRFSMISFVAQSNRWADAALRAGRPRERGFQEGRLPKEI